MRNAGLATLAAAMTALVACGTEDNLATSTSAATIACTDPSVAAVFSSDCSATTGFDVASCLVGAPPVCVVTRPGCSCSGDGSNLYAAIQGVTLCSRNAEQTRESMLSKLCGVETQLAAGKPDGACKRIQDLESAIWAKQAKLDKDIQHADADALRAGAQAVEAALAAAGTSCPAVTPAVP